MILLTRDQRIALQAALSYAGSNADDLNEAFGVYSDGHGPDVRVAGQERMIPFTEREFDELWLAVSPHIHVVEG